MTLIATIIVWTMPSFAKYARVKLYSPRKCLLITVDGRILRVRSRYASFRLLIRAIILIGPCILNTSFPDLIAKRDCPSSLSGTDISLFAVIYITFEKGKIRHYCKKYFLFSCFSLYIDNTRPLIFRHTVQIQLLAPLGLRPTLAP